MTTVLAITGFVMLIELVAGWASRSAALVADAGHMLTDSLGLVAALFAAWLATRPPASARTFGWLRGEVLAALLNGLVVSAVGVWAIIGGVQRILAPAPDIRVGLMAGAAALGLAANVASAAILRGGQRGSLNIRGAYLEVLGDAMGSVAVLVSAALVTAGHGWADGAASVVVGMLIVPRAANLLRDVLRVLLEEAPAGVDLQAVRNHIRSVDGVLDVHDLHVWTITSGVPVMSAHVVVAPDRLADSGEILHALRSCLAAHFDVEHSTFQIESPSTQAAEPPIRI